MSLSFDKYLRAQLAFWLGCLLLPGSSPALDLHAERSSPLDLAITGKLSGVPAGTTRYLHWADLGNLPTRRLTLQRAFGLDAVQVTVLFLSDLRAAIPHAPGADTLLATCSDGYASVYRDDFIAAYRPFLILAINGVAPSGWPPPGINYQIAPHVISIAAEVVPAVAPLMDGAHKRPWGVVQLEFASYAERFGGAYRERWAGLSPRAVAGRDLWINSCASCHQGPGRIFGGTKSDRPFEALVALALGDAGYFRQYVRDPKSKVPGATMEPHPHYTDDQLAALIAFITAEPK